MARPEWVYRRAAPVVIVNGTRPDGVRENKRPMKRTVVQIILWLFLLPGASGATTSDFSVNLLGGGRFTLHEYRGEKPVLLKFWATWCAACLKEMPAYRELHAEYGARVQFLAVNVAINDPLRKVRAAVREHELTMPVAYDAAGRLWQQFNVIGTPMYVLIAGDGTIAFTGHRHDERLALAMDAVLARRIVDTEQNGPADIPDGLADIDGKPVQLATGKNEMLVVYHFAAWCESYLRETYPEHAERCRQFRGNIGTLVALELPGTRFIGFATRYSSSRESVQQYRARYGIVHQLVFDTTGVFAERFGVRDFPHVVVIRNGAVVHSADRIDAGLIENLQHIATGLASPH